MILNTTYFGPVSWYRHIARAMKPVFIDTQERFVKQTNRSRCRIATANGVQTLSVPLTYNNGDIITDVRISDHNNWRHLHWQALSSAYGSSPFFEYYADDLRPFFEEKWEFLYDYNRDITLKMCELIGINADIQPKDLLPSDEEKARCSHANHPAVSGNETVMNANKQFIVNANAPSQREYYQVFKHRHGFIPDLSILDLLFNMGPEAILFLKK